MINGYICELADYGLRKGLLGEEDRIYAINRILDVLKLDDFEEKAVKGLELEEILRVLLDFACEKGLIENNVTERDLFDTRLMDTLMPRPSEVISNFDRLYIESPKLATDYYYNLSKNSDYIRTYRVSKDMKWVVDTEYGDLDITINLSKPEKDPKAIAAARKAASVSYPKCLLCKENVGYAGRLNHPARQTHRVIPVTINNSAWYMQYSPYVYYNEHCILFNGEHTPMKIEEATFRKLFDFVEQFPHYILGSNADLPIVGGSILSHDHFQGGCYEFAMAKAASEKEVKFKDYEDVRASIVKWPMSVIRLNSEDREKLIRLSSRILDKWIEYSDEAAYIYAYTNGERHNTITPIVRTREGRYEIDLVLRNNITTDERPDGLYHPNASLHHIKKENIGLIEVMGLAILPSRLKTELGILKEYILENKDISSNEEIKKHADWAEGIKKKYDGLDDKNIDEILNKEVGLVFKEVLEDAGVYKCTKEGREPFLRFIDYVNE